MVESTEDTLAGLPLESKLDASGQSSTGGGLDATLLSGTYAKRSTSWVEPGAIIGRYVVLAKLGAGAMGVVFAAYDPELDRKVALKLLAFHDDDQGLARARLKREAQALAKLAHPNVVAVHDVGEREGASELFVAMEFVDGQTLGEWLAEGPRPWPEVVRVLSAAGRGLAAAHGAGLVHRDFKPDNVMIGRDGRVRVMDFGLARTALAGEEPGERVPAELSTAVLLDSRMTQTGALLGTPAYMAYELFEGRPADPLSDQFGFCVTLHEALYGRRPFAGDNVGQLMLAIGRGELPEPPRGSTVPSWLRKAVARGLARAPSERWPSMDALLAALANDPAIRRRRVGAAALFVAALAGGLWGVQASRAPEPERCVGAAAKLTGIWDATRRAEVQAALSATELGHADQTSKLVSAGLDGYTTRWVELRTEACEATQRGEQSEAMLDAQMACLDQRLAHVRATVEVLASADAAVLNKATDAIAALPGLDRCADLEALAAEVPPPEDPQEAATAEALGERLARAEVLQRHGKADAALALADEIVAEAAALAHVPLVVRAGLVQGHLQHDVGRYDDAEATYVAAYEAAVAARLAPEAAEAAAQLVFIVGERLARPAEGRRWALDAKPLATAAGTDEARALYLVNLGAVAITEGSYDEAKTLLEGAVEAWTAAYGPQHPRVGACLSNLGVVAARQGNRAEARAYYERALEIREAALGPDHPTLSAQLGNLGSLARSEGDFAAAQAYLERALTLSEALGPGRPESGFALNNLGSLALDQGQHERAQHYFEAAHDVWSATLGPEHPNTLIAAINLGDLAINAGRNADAAKIYEAMLPLAEQAFGPEHVMLVHPLRGLGIARLRLGDTEAATALLERALALPGVVDGDPDVLAEVRFALAQALAKTDRSSIRARELAALARDGYVALGEPKRERVGEIDTWLANQN